MAVWNCSKIRDTNWYQSSGRTKESPGASHPVTPKMQKNIPNHNKRLCQQHWHYLHKPNTFQQHPGYHRYHVYKCSGPNKIIGIYSHGNAPCLYQNIHIHIFAFVKRNPSSNLEHTFRTPRIVLKQKPYSATRRGHEEALWCINPISTTSH